MVLISKAEAMEIGEILSHDFSNSSDSEEFEAVSQYLLSFIERKIGEPVSWKDLEELPILASQLRPAVHVLSTVCHGANCLVVTNEVFESLYYFATYLIENRSFSSK